MDTPTKDRIAKLHPSVRNEVTSIIQECDTALTGRAKVRVTQGLRTFAEQDALYQQGRTTIGQKVTNAKAGQSIHNYGFAIDICLIIDGKMASWETTKDWDNDQIADWYECVKIFAKYGWEWGGNWKTFKDLPHFDKRGFNKWQALAKLKLDKNGYVILL
ncbi:M15 family metallopeptidase [Flavobacterium sp. UBA7682]|uniref:M15 family metallopeptidase n=1 Tax=Flavobacterium sp. UBA7682 TaxID=1946560 RepID=UPI0025C0DA96|nr:M15 family metallopeptidase [Flavobacterium sp. UBA7682]